MRFLFLLAWLSVVVLAAPSNPGLLFSILDHMNVEINDKQALSCRSVSFRRPSGDERLTLQVHAATGTKAQVSVHMFRANDSAALRFYVNQSPVELFEYVNPETGVFRVVEKMREIPGIESLLSFESGHFKLKSEETVTFSMPLPEPGIYCAMIATKKRRILDTISVQLAAVGSQGNLDSRIVVGSQTLFACSIIGGVLLLLAARKRSMLASSKLARKPILVVLIVQRILLPFEAILVARCLCTFALQAVGPFSSVASVLTRMDSLLHYLFQGQRYLSQYYVLLFARGYGLFYKLQNDSSSYAVFPEAMKKWPRRFLATDLLTRPILLAILALLTHLPEDSSYKSALLMGLLVTFLVMMGAFQSIGHISKIFLPYRYRKQTAKRLSGLKPKTTGQGVADILYTQRCFNWSIFIVSLANILRPIAAAISLSTTAATDVALLERSRSSFWLVGDIAFECVHVWLISVPLFYIWSAERCRSSLLETTEHKEEKRD